MFIQDGDSSSWATEVIARLHQLSSHGTWCACLHPIVFSEKIWKWFAEVPWGPLGYSNCFSAFCYRVCDSVGQSSHTDTSSWCLHFASSLIIIVSQFHIDCAQVKGTKCLPGCKQRRQSWARLSSSGGASVETKTQQLRPCFLQYPLLSVSLIRVSDRFITFQL